jgi:hypothetical protein
MKSPTLFILAFLLLHISAFSQDVQFSASAPSAVKQDSRFQLVFSVNKEASDLRLPDLKAFQILMGPSTSSRTQVNIINGKVNRDQEFTYTFILKANQKGTFTIPPASIEIDGKKYESNQLTIEVIEGDPDPVPSNTQNQRQEAPIDNSTASDDEVFISMTANKSSVYQSEPVLITTRIFTRVNLEGISDITNPNFRDFIAEDLTTNQDIQWSLQNVNGKTYRVGTYNQKILFPQKSGTLTIDPTSMEFMIRQRQARQSTNIFDDFFDSYRTVKRRVSSKSLKITVKSLPSPQPEGFSGVVGKIEMDVSASKKLAKINDGITIKTVISGLGNLKLAEAPKLAIPADFDVFDPNVSNNLTQTSLGTKGSKTFEQLIIPRHSGTFEIPSVTYSFFNPSSGRYQTLKSQPIVLEIEKSEGEQASGPEITRPGSTNRESIQFLGEDIRFIKSPTSHLKPANTFLFGTWPFTLGYLIPALMFIVIFFIYKKKIKENANVRLMRTKRANKLARKRLKKAAQLLKADQSEAFYEELSKGLWGYISDKLSIPGSELTRDNVRQILSKNDAPEENIEGLLQILDTCEFARYSPASEERERENLYKQSIEIISKLENNLKKTKF